MKYNVKDIMKRAHEIAKALVGDYAAKMSMAMKQAWAEAKKATAKTGKTVEEYLASLGLKVWEKNNHRRIYINHPVEIAKAVGIEDSETCKWIERYRLSSELYYDCVDHSFTFRVSRAPARNSFNALCDTIRTAAKNA